MNLIFKCLILLFCIIGNLLAKDSSDREKAIFNNNLKLYTEGDYKQAEQNFSLVITKLPDSPLSTTNYLMLIKCRYKLNDYTSTIEYGKKFLEK